MHSWTTFNIGCGLSTCSQHFPHTCHKVVQFWSKIIFTKNSQPGVAITNITEFGQRSWRFECKKKKTTQLRRRNQKLTESYVGTPWSLQEIFKFKLTSPSGAVCGEDVERMLQVKYLWGFCPIMHWQNVELWIKCWISGGIIEEKMLNWGSFVGEIWWKCC